ncbi:transposase [Shewanella sedimentimangrovi]|uniref:Transposase n=1 Tax=Shewanella sedimentimangrovi TaxID=2814293 RepID=A0ABX7QXJ0_9GAMM|nr:transposase [Shewanella sedimentimangrovi]QSX35610.1 transposase [Shewanella sedimentimangrovi]
MHIFVSRPTWVSPEFDAGLEVFLTLIQNIGLIPRTLGSSDYPSKAPLDEVIEIMEECKGAIILGFPQLLITEGKIKDHEIEAELSLPTEWNHIEAALAYSKGLPLIMFHHKGVTRGVFDRGVMNAFIHEVDFTSATWSMEPALNGAIKKWKANCESGNSNFGVTATVDPNKPTCPNCSNKSKPMYLSPLPSSMKRFGSWTCSACNYRE